MNDQATGLREAARAAGVQPSGEIDYRALWLGRKAELARKAEGHCITVYTVLDGDVKVGQVRWEQNFRELLAYEELNAMEQEEAFARVRAEMGRKI